MMRLLLFGLLGTLGLLASLPCQGQTWQWASAQTSGTTGPVQFTTVALDGAGNTVVAGSFQGTVTLGPFTLTSAGGTDGIVARLSPTGGWLQAVAVGGPNEEAITSVAVSATDVVWVAGGFNTNLSLGGVTLTGGNSVSGIYNGLFLASLTATGQWQQVAQATNLVQVSRLLPEQNGDVLLVGNYFDAATTFGSVVLPRPVIRNTVVARYRPGTGWLHVVHATNGGYMYLDGIALDATGTLVLAGYLPAPPSLTVTFGSQTALIPPNSSGSGGLALVVARFGLGGTWTQLACASPGTASSAEVALALDPNGEVLVASSLTAFRGTFGALSLQNPVPTGSSPFPFLARLSAAGTWIQMQGGVGPGQAAILRRDGSYLSLLPSPTSFAVTATTATGVTTPLVTASSPFGITLGSLAVSATGQLVVAGTFLTPSAAFGSLTLATLFPNPARRAATLRWPAPVAEPLLITLFDALGHLVRQQTVPVHTAEAVLDLASLSPGLYLVRAGTTTSRLAVE